ncbi:SDR family oxidoreductase [Aquabacter sp. CN5-332]|uniref:SDR family NAD(P)-dependent oxidoreductase n=1 Tax=Aquabacter sp. CN5-332 TaxID=3156608 RepID=UPI0032B36FE7
MSDALPLAGRIALVVGGSGGIGSATAERLAALGASVTVTYRSRAEDARALVARLPGAGHAAEEAAVEDSASLARLAETMKARHGALHILVNAAGFTKAVKHVDLDALDDELIDRMFAVNWRGSFAAVRSFAPLLKESGDGLIVNVSSIAGTNGVGSNIAYCAVKAGIDVMTKSLARALAPAVRVMAVSPGVVDTDFVPGRDASFNEKVSATIPLKRIATAGDVADAIIACATTLKYSTGSIIMVDGGRAL